MNRAFYPGFSLAVAAATAATLAACSRIDVPKVPGVTPYRMEIQQGNYISQEMLEQLKPGMTREQVRFVLGTPLVTDIFHANRWDFVYFREQPNGKREQRNLSVIFEDNKLVRVVGDLLPSGAAKPAAAAFPALKPATEAPKPAEETKEERGFFGRLIDRVTPEKAAESMPTPKPDPKPAAEPPAGQNWSAASDEPAAKPQPAPEAAAPTVGEKKPEAEKREEDAKERGFFGRMLEKMGL